MLRIGFANQYYTLWDVRKEADYVTDSFGQYHKVRDKELFSYIKNISMDLEKVKAEYPNVTIDEDLKGKFRSFEISNKEEDLCPEILKFGKYFGRNVHDLVETDFKYVLWLNDNTYSFALKQIISQLPKVVEHFAKIEKEKEERMNSYKLIESGMNEITFASNPNRQAIELDEIYQNQRELMLDQIPSTLNWVEVNQYPYKIKDWFHLVKAECPNYNYEFTIMKYKDEKTFHLSLAGSLGSYASLEEAKKHAEVQVLANAHKLNDYYKEGKFAHLAKSNYATVEIAPNHTLYVMIDEVKYVGGKYPYYMGVVNGKLQKLKGKTFNLNLEVIYTNKTEHSCVQYAVIK